MIGNAPMVDVKVIFIHVINAHVWILLRKYPAFCFDKKWEVDPIQDGTPEKFQNMIELMIGQGTWEL